MLAVHPTARPRRAPTPARPLPKHVQPTPESPREGNDEHSEHCRPPHHPDGAVITQAGTDQNVGALVYIAAFAPDKDESVDTL